MFSFLVLLISFIPQGAIPISQVQGSYVQVQSNVREAEVQTQNLQVRNSSSELPDGLRVAPVNTLTLTNAAAQ